MGLAHVGAHPWPDDAEVATGVPLVGQNIVDKDKHPKVSAKKGGLRSLWCSKYISSIGI